MDVFLVKTRLGHLAPVDESARESLRAFGEGEVLRAKITRPRNVKRHRLFFALLNTVHMNLPEEMEARFPTVERLRKELLVQTGHFEMHQTLGGKTVIFPGSMSFDAMDETEFLAFFESAFKFVAKHILTGVDQFELREEIESAAR